MKQIKIPLPESKDELKISTYMKLKEIEGIENISDKDRVLLVVQEIYGLTKEEAKQIKFTDVMEITEHFAYIMNQKEERQVLPIIEYNGVQYGCIPDLDEIVLNEFIDLEESEKSPLYSNIFMNVMYRKIIDSDKKSKYRIESYDDSIEVDFGDLPVSVLERAKVFFYNLGTQLIINTEMKLDNMIQTLPKRSESIINLKDGMPLSTVSLKDTSQTMTEYLMRQYIEPFRLTTLIHTLATLRENELKDSTNDRD